MRFPSLWHRTLRPALREIKGQGRLRQINAVRRNRAIFASGKGRAPMIKTILVPVGGSDSDPVVFETARMVAEPFGAHLDFFHVRIGPGEAAMHVPHVQFARGEGLHHALGRLDEQARVRSVDGARGVRDFCDQWQIPLVEAPAPDLSVSASYCEEAEHAEQRLIERARHHDLVVMARPTGPNGLPPDLLEGLLRQTGCPILLAAARPPASLTGTIMVCWKDAPEPARALTAALPLLRQADRVVAVTVAADEAVAVNGPESVARHLAWHGIHADAQTVPASHSVASALQSAAKECRACLLVMGCYGHGRAYEVLFGSCTETLVRNSELPIFLLH
jgi:nucleotide-binding universal stress UspA family protein